MYFTRYSLIILHVCDTYQINLFQSLPHNDRWDEMGLYDIPATLEYILRITGRQKLLYIGHSMGNSNYFMSNDKGSVDLTIDVDRNSMGSRLFDSILYRHNHVLGSHGIAPRVKRKNRTYGTNRVDLKFRSIHVKVQRFLSFSAAIQFSDRIGTRGFRFQNEITHSNFYSIHPRIPSEA